MELIFVIIGSYLIGSVTSAQIGWGIFLVACAIAPDRRR